VTAPESSDILRSPENTFFPVERPSSQLRLPPIDSLSSRLVRPRIACLVPIFISYTHVIMFNVNVVLGVQTIFRKLHGASGGGAPASPVLLGGPWSLLWARAATTPLIRVLAAQEYKQTWMSGEWDTRHATRDALTATALLLLLLLDRYLTHPSLTLRPHPHKQQ